MLETETQLWCVKSYFFGKFFKKNSILFCVCGKAMALLKFLMLLPYVTNTVKPLGKI